MPLSTKVSGTWKDISAVHVKVAGVWKPVQDMWTKVSGVWEQVYSSLSAAITGTLTQSIPTAPGTVDATAFVSITGTGPFTYNWSYTGTPTSVSSNTGSGFTLSLTSAFPINRTGTVTCEVTDTYGNITTAGPEPWSLTVGVIPP